LDELLLWRAIIETELAVLEEQVEVLAGHAVGRQEGTGPGASYRVLDPIVPDANYVEDRLVMTEAARLPEDLFKLALR
jgi:hypothetical protein